MNFLKSQVFPIIKMVLIALILTFVLILAFALITRWASLGSNVVSPVTYVLKCLSVVIACLIAFRKTDNGLIKGLIGGLLYFFFAYLIFAALNNFQNCPFNVAQHTTIQVRPRDRRRVCFHARWRILHGHARFDIVEHFQIIGSVAKRNHLTGKNVQAFP